MKNAFYIAVLFMTCGLQAQTISGRLEGMPLQSIALYSFDGFESYEVDAVLSDEQGEFSLTYATQDQGVGYLVAGRQNPYILILGSENTKLAGATLEDLPSLKILEGQENQLFVQYATEQPKRDQALLIWEFLTNLYQEPLFKSYDATTFANEIERLKSEDDAFIAKLPEESYISWYLPSRKLVSSVSTVAQYRPAEIPAVISAFRTLDHADDRLFKSGLLKEAIEGHFWLIENSGWPLDTVFIEMEKSIDAMINQLSGYDEKLNLITDYLFDLLERNSLFKASEYLALKVLNETSCTLNSDLAKQLETYRAMKIGNKAPDIKFNTPFLKYGLYTPSEVKSLNDITTPYTLVVFGASWCPKCASDIPEIAQKYPQWKANGVEVIFVSLDESEEELEAFAKTLPFTTLCDFKKWESPIVEEFYVFGTPTMYLLNQDLEIELRPTSVAQMDAWVDWFLNKKDKS